jgi:hypothetical protein
MHNNQCKKGDLLQLPVQAIADKWDSAVAALDLFLGYLRHDFGCIRADMISSTDVIAPPSIITSDMQFSREIHMPRLTRLYWTLVFSLYLSGAPDTKSARIVREWFGGEEAGYRDDADALPEAIRQFALSVEDLDEATKASAVYKGVMTLLISRGARDFGRERHILKEMSGSAIEDHHIFPQQFLRNHGIKGYIANSILNRTPILQETNRAISSDPPSKYFRDKNIIRDEPITDQILSEHALSRDVLDDVFTTESFNRFRYARRDKLRKIILESVGVG